MGKLNFQVSVYGKVEFFQGECRGKIASIRASSTFSYLYILGLWGMLGTFSDVFKGVGITLTPFVLM